MDVNQVKELLSSKKAIYEENGWTDTDDYRKVVNRLSELEYYAGLNTLEAQQKSQAIIDAVVAEEERAGAQEQRIAEVDEMELPFDFDADFGASGLNTIIRQMLKEERANNFAEFNAEYERIQAEVDEKVRGAEERELQLQRQNSELQEQNSQNERTIETMYNEAKGLRDQINALSSDIAALRTENNDLKNRNAEIEQNRKNAADQLEEAQNEIIRLEKQISVGERQAQRTIDVTPNLQQVYEQAKQATAEKRKVMVTANIGLYREIVDENGNKDVVHESVLQEVDIVDSFPALPDIESAVEYKPNGTEQTVDAETVVQSGSEDAGYSDTDQEIGDTIPTDETASQEANSEEVGEEIYAPIGKRLHETHEEWVIRTLNELQIVVYGSVDIEEAA